MFYLPRGLRGSLRSIKPNMLLLLRRRLPLSVRMRNTSTSTQQYIIYIIIVHTHTVGQCLRSYNTIYYYYNVVYYVLHRDALLLRRTTEYKTENFFFTRVFIDDRTNRVRVHYTRIKCNIGLVVFNKLYNSSRTHARTHTHTSVFCAQQRVPYVRYLCIIYV